MTNNNKLTKVALAVAVLCNPALASAEADSDKAPEATEKVEQIVVTGSFSGIAIRKEEASYAISSFAAEDFIKISPKSTADLFKMVPGVWAESSGGVAGANVFVRGFPSGGDAPFLTVQLQNIPIYTPPTLSFLENSSMFRVDETISFMEALRGGPNPVVSNGQPGLTTNFLLKEGSEVTEGLVKYSVSDYGQQRVDGVLSGELTDDVYFMAGGYVRRSPGARDAGFNAEDGKQFTVNLTADIDNGRLNFFTRMTDDHGIWYLPTALNVDGVDNTYTQLGPANRQVTLQYGPDGQSESFDLADGRGWNGTVSGGSIDLELAEGWMLVNRFGYTEGDANTYGMVPNGSPVALSTVADNGSNALGAVSGQQYGGDTTVQQIGRWIVKKALEAFTNDLMLSHSFDEHTLTLGYFHSDYSAKDWWALGNQAYHVVKSGGEMLTGIDCNDNQDSCGWNYDINSTGDGSTAAIYGAGTFQVSEYLQMDLGLRSEKHEIDYSVDEGLDGSIDKFVDYSKRETAWTIGANWMFNSESGMFARMNKGSKMPYFDDFRDNFTAYSNGDNLIKEVSQYETGYKLNTDNYRVFATFFANEVKGDTFVPRPGAPVETLTNEAYGIELDMDYQFNDALSIHVGATYQKTEITESPDNKGNEAQRQPGWQVRIAPTWLFELPNGMYGSLYGTFTAVDDRFANNANTVVLDGFEKFDIGMQVNLTEQMSLQLSVNNLTDEDALTEGDPRDPQSPNGRYILPRTAELSLSYQF